MLGLSLALTSRRRPRALHEAVDHHDREDSGEKGRGELFQCHARILTTQKSPVSSQNPPVVHVEVEVEVVVLVTLS